ncbi:MAG TPA: hypothetical protein ENF22_08940 [Chloroflexi bacterium]|nr:hypothetical protein [Chloroflexota bacterium]
MKQKNTLLRIPIKRIIINREGEIISDELHPPFSYLSTLIDQNISENEEGSGSEFVTLGAQLEPLNDVERFLSLICFEQRTELERILKMKKN